MNDHTPSSEPDGLRAVIVLATTLFGVVIIVTIVALFSILKSPAAATLATPERMRESALARSKPPTPASADGITMAEGFVAERVIEVPKEIGSIASLCVLPDGSLILGPQEGKLARLRLETGSIEQIDLPIGDAQGLVAVDGALYVVVNGDAAQGQGLYRVADANGDGQFDEVKLLRAIPGDTGEHGAHGVVVGPDRKLYITVGNHAKLPTPERSLVPPLWREDFLLPRMWDANGHAVGVMAPGGFVVRTDLKGEVWELVSVGYRNAYDVAFSPSGDLFTYDSDMEWDIGAPWYRPTAVCHVVPGSEFGWRSGSACPPTWYVDVSPPMVTLGPGSPTGLLFGTDAAFPAPWRDALFCLDWTYATIHAVFLEEQGASYRGRVETFLMAKGLPLTDAVIHPTDGAMYVSTGGRGAASSIYRIRSIEARGELREPTVTRERETRQALERAFHADAPDEDVRRALRELGSSDRHVRFAARTVLEHQDPARWMDQPLPEPTSAGVIHHALALIRAGDASLRDQALRNILALDWSRLDVSDQRDALRAIVVGLSRHGLPTGEIARDLMARVETRLPSGDQGIDRLAVEILVALESPTVIAKALTLMESTDASSEVFDPALLSRNDRYGSVILKMAADNPRQQQIAMATALRVAKKGWTKPYRERYFRWFVEAKRAAGGHSFAGFLDRIRDDALQGVPEAERDRYQVLARGGSETPATDRPTAEGPGRRWTTDDVQRVATTMASGRDFARGERMYRAASCADCHRCAGVGNAGGPDLTGVGQRFGVRELAEAIVEPSKVISDQYRFEEFSLADGSMFVGRVVNQTDEQLTVIESLLAPEATRAVARRDVLERRPSPVSPMLSGLIDALSESELADLLAYLKAGGDPRDPIFAAPK